MDPISVLGIASAIITFIDFSWGLVSGTIEVHRKGRVSDDQDIGAIVSDLESITDDLRKRGPGLTRAERSIADLSEQCLATSQEIQKLLHPLMAKSLTKRTIWKSVKAQWAIMTGKEKIDELRSKLQGHREQLLLTSVMRRGAYKPFWAQFPSTISMSKKKAPVLDLSSDSFVHVAAYNGLKKFVLKEVNLTPGLLHTRNDLNLLVSAALGNGYARASDLVGKLLDLHADLDGTYPIRDEKTGLTERWPVWVVMSIALTQRSLLGIVSNNEVLEVVRDLERIYRYALDRGWNAAMTFTVWPEGRYQPSETPYESRQIDLGEFVRFGQTSNPDPIPLHRNGEWVNFFLGNEIGMKGISNADYKIHRVTWGPDK